MFNFFGVWDLILRYEKALLGAWATISNLAYVLVSAYLIMKMQANTLLVGGMVLIVGFFLYGPYLFSVVLLAIVWLFQLIITYPVYAIIFLYLLKVSRSSGLQWVLRHCGCDFDKDKDVDVLDILKAMEKKKWLGERSALFFGKLHYKLHYELKLFRRVTPEMQYCLLEEVKKDTARTEEMLLHRTCQSEKWMTNGHQTTLWSDELLERMQDFEQRCRSKSCTRESCDHPQTTDFPSQSAVSTEVTPLRVSSSVGSPGGGSGGASSYDAADRWRRGGARCKDRQAEVAALHSFSPANSGPKALV